jgi:hypothetical protein
MLGTALKLFKPSYAIIALVLFGGWQGYSIVRSGPGWDWLWEKSVKEAPPAEESAEPLPDGIWARTMAITHPVKRIAYWLLTYILMCVACVPLMKWGLMRESNLINGGMLGGFCLFGVMLAYMLLAFRWSWTSALWLVIALGISGGFFVWLSTELEKLRIEDGMG